MKVECLMWSKTCIHKKILSEMTEICAKKKAMYTLSKRSYYENLLVMSE